MAEISISIESLAELKGTLSDSPQAMLSALRVYSSVNKEVARAYVYTSLQRDADQREPEAQARFGLSRQMFSDLSEAVSWINPEVLSIGESRVNQFLNAEPALADFEFMIRDILRQEPHTLDEATGNYLGAGWNGFILAKSDISELRQRRYSMAYSYFK
jgi:oligoendopeptidase F